MSTYGAAQAAQPVEPPRRVVLPPSAFKPGPDCPTEPATLGIRILSEGDTMALRREAYNAASKSYPDLEPDDPVWISHYNQALMLAACVVAVCDRDDRTKPWHEYQRSIIPNLLAPGGVERIWDELEELTIETSPTAPEATPEDLARLAAILPQPEAFSHLSAADARGLRRMLRHALSRLTPPA